MYLFRFTRLIYRFQLHNVELISGVVHQRAVVRCAAASLFQSVVSHTPDNLLAARVVPALVTLASDPELSVKLAVIPTLGMNTFDFRCR